MRVTSRSVNLMMPPPPPPPPPPRPGAHRRPRPSRHHLRSLSSSLSECCRSLRVAQVSNQVGRWAWLLHDVRCQSHRRSLDRSGPNPDPDIPDQCHEKICGAGAGRAGVGTKLTRLPELFPPHAHGSLVVRSWWLICAGRCQGPHHCSTTCKSSTFRGTACAVFSR